MIRISSSPLLESWCTGISVESISTRMASIAGEALSGDWVLVVFDVTRVCL
jgi:hypothetical protein